MSGFRVVWAVRLLKLKLRVLKREGCLEWGARIRVLKGWLVALVHHRYAWSQSSDGPKRH